MPFQVATRLLRTINAPPPVPCTLEPAREHGHGRRQLREIDVGKHRHGIRHKKQGRPRAGGPAAASGSVETSSAQPEQPEQSGSDPAQRIGSGAAARNPAPTDIERADERKSGSVEALPHTDASAGLASFTDSPDQAAGDPGTAPYLRED